MNVHKLVGRIAALEAELDELRRRRREMALKMVASGVSQSFAARLFGVTRARVGQWVAGAS